METQAKMSIAIVVYQTGGVKPKLGATCKLIAFYE